MKQKKEDLHQLLDRFRQFGIKHQLRLSSQEILSNGIMGVDGLNRKLLVVIREGKDMIRSFVLLLSDIKSCTVKKYYGSILAGGLKHKKLDQYLQRVVLRLELNNGNGVLELPFYAAADGNIDESGRMEHKAGRWQLMLSKLRSAVKKEEIGDRPKDQLLNQQS